LADPVWRLSDNRSGSTGGAVNVRSLTLERQLLQESSDRSGSIFQVFYCIIRSKKDTELAARIVG